MILYFEDISLELRTFALAMNSLYLFLSTFCLIVHMSYLTPAPDRPILVPT